MGNGRYLDAFGQEGGWNCWWVKHMRKEESGMTVYFLRYLASSRPSFNGKTWSLVALTGTVRPSFNGKTWGLIALTGTIRPTFNGKTWVWLLLLGQALMFIHSSFYLTDGQCACFLHLWSRGSCILELRKCDLKRNPHVFCGMLFHVLIAFQGGGIRAVIRIIWGCEDATFMLTLVASYKTHSGPPTCFPMWCPPPCSDGAIEPTPNAENMLLAWLWVLPFTTESQISLFFKN